MLAKPKFNNFSVLGIPEILMNIMICHGFDRSPNSSVIPPCSNALVPYYTPNLFTLLNRKTVYTRIFLKMWWSKSIVLVFMKMILFWNFKHKFHILSIPWTNYPFHKRFIVSLILTSLMKNKNNNIKSNPTFLLNNV